MGQGTRCGLSDTYCSKDYIVARKDSGEGTALSGVMFECRNGATQDTPEKQVPTWLKCYKQRLIVTLDYAENKRTVPCVKLRYIRELIKEVIKSKMFCNYDVRWVEVLRMLN